MMTISPDDRKQMRQRAKEWQAFRRDYLYTQAELAQAMGCAKRTVTNVESEVTVCPSFTIQRKFRWLGRKHSRR
jgi:DNA-binding XRE family transcriptional regulator